MASYTMQLREYIESWSEDNIDNMKTRDVIEAGRTKLFDFDYPIFDPAYKNVFETHFIRNFYMREIGFETEGLFKFYLETWLLINMPYFNKMFESELLKFDPLSNANVTDSTNRTGKATTNNSSSTNASSNSKDDRFARNLESNQPDTRLAITANDGEGVIEYASAIDEHNENNSTSSSGKSNQSASASANSTEEYLATRSGKTGDVSYSKLLGEYRDSLLRIEKRIFDEMNELFMLVY
jgi:hypothetical protein